MLDVGTIHHNRPTKVDKMLPSAQIHTLQRAVTALLTESNTFLSKMGSPFLESDCHVMLLSDKSYSNVWGSDDNFSSTKWI